MAWFCCDLVCFLGALVCVTLLPDSHWCTSGPMACLLADPPLPSSRPQGANLDILKVEIGGDTQSTEATEASHMHTRGDGVDEAAYNRGYEVRRGKGGNSLLHNSSQLPGSHCMCSPQPGIPATSLNTPLNICPSPRPFPPTHTSTNLHRRAARPSDPVVDDD